VLRRRKVVSSAAVVAVAKAVGASAPGAWPYGAKAPRRLTQTDSAMRYAPAKPIMQPLGSMMGFASF